MVQVSGIACDFRMIPAAFGIACDFQMIPVAFGIVHSF
jgi:hypothetical protein